MKPYTNIPISEDKFTRIFDANVDPDELVWHRDRRDRHIRVVKNEGWKIQFDNELPVDINSVEEIPRMVYHRLIKGQGSLVLEIEEL